MRLPRQEPLCQRASHGLFRPRPRLLLVEIQASTHRAWRVSSWERPVNLADLSVAYLVTNPYAGVHSRNLGFNTNFINAAATGFRVGRSHYHIDPAYKFKLFVDRQR